MVINKDDNWFTDDKQLRQKRKNKKEGKKSRKWLKTRHRIKHRLLR